MRISYYCQHVLGIGHLRRSIEICKALAQSHETTLILGGPDVSVDTSGLKILQLPGLQMDSDFNNLAPCDRSISLSQTKEQRQQLLYNHFETSAPECFITELYPFGRKAFRFEIDPVLGGIAKGTLARCKCICSVRDILVEKEEGKEKFESRVVNIVNTFYDAVLVHADPTIITLEETFTPLAEITTPIHYTGFVSEKNSTKRSNTIRDHLKLQKAQKLIVVSFGGGSVGRNLLRAVVPAFKEFLRIEPTSHVQIFTGPYCSMEDYEFINSQAQYNISVDRFTENFPDWLSTADLSISMAGYNTCMNLLQTGIPALVLPFEQNREQALRVEKISTKAPITRLTDEDLSPQRLSQMIAAQLQLPKTRSSIDLHGATTSCSIIDNLLATHS